MATNRPATVASNAADALDAQEREIERLRDLVIELADDLEEELRVRHDFDRGRQDQLHPAMRPKYARDMEVVDRARTIVRALDGEQP
jgi:hypothetical protein